MEKLGLAVYGRIDEKEEVFKIGFLGNVEFSRLEAGSYLIKYSPIGHSRDLPELELGENEIWDIDNLDPIYIDFDEIENYEFSEEANFLVLFMKDGTNHMLAYDSSEEGQLMYKHLRIAVFVAIAKTKL